MNALSSEEQIAGDPAFLPIFLDRKNLAKEPSLLGKIFPFCSPRAPECNLLGKGGYGAVYKIKGPDPDNTFYALKIIEYASECSLREVRTLQQLTGKRIFPDFVAAFKQTSFGKTTLGIFMELLEDSWQSLPKLLFGNESIYAKNADDMYIRSIDDRKNFFRTLGPMILALKYRLHAQGKVHHDIKPDNIRIQLDGTYKVIDARFVDAGSTEDIGEEYSERSCPGTVFYSLATAARGFEHGPLYDRQKDPPDIQAQQLNFDLRMKGLHNKVVPLRNDFSITQLYRVINRIILEEEVRRELESGWPLYDRNSGLISRRLNAPPKVTSIKQIEGPRDTIVKKIEKLNTQRQSRIDTAAKKKRRGGKRTTHRKKTHKKKRRST